MSTIKDVARLAGVSSSTVSRTLTGRVFVDEKTREKVMEAVRALDYHPNAVAKGLREGKSRELAFLVPDINSLYYPMIMKSMERAASERGYTLSLHNCDEQIRREKEILGSLRGRNIGGVLCMSVKDEVTHLLEFQKEEQCPVILINRYLDEALSSVTVDHEAGSYAMTRYLLEKGHRNFVIMLGNLDHERFRERYYGAKRALTEFGIGNGESYFITNIGTIEEAYSLTKNIFSEKAHPDAIFATMDILAIGVYSALASLGLGIPEDVSVVSFDNIFMSRYLNPPLTTYTTEVEAIAEKAINLIAGWGETSRRKELPLEKIRITGAVEERESVKAL